MEKVRYFRYEMSFNGIRQNIGFISGMEKAGLGQETVTEIKDVFDEHLPFPPYEDWDESMGFACAFFTKAGVQRFGEEIEYLKEFLEALDNGWEIVEIQSYGFPEKDVLYQDKYQIVALSPHTMGLAPFEPIMADL